MLFKETAKRGDIVKNIPTTEKIVEVKRVKKNQKHTVPIVITMIQGKLFMLTLQCLQT